MGVKWQHSQFNIYFILTALLVQLPLTVFVLKTIQWCGLHHWGIYYELPFSTGIIWKSITGIVLLDFFEYLYHLMMHKFNYFWAFHLIHHTDKQLDVSTTVREHPIETMVRVCFMILTVYITGVPILVLMIRQFIQSLANITSHTSISFSNRFERFFKLIFITPDLHKVHHHHKLPYTDCNYGDILCIWDRIFGTYKELDSSKIVYGLDIAEDKEIQNFKQLLKYPFKIIFKTKDS